MCRMFGTWLARPDQAASAAGTDRALRKKRGVSATPGRWKRKGGRLDLSLPPSKSGGLCDHPVRVENELLRRAMIEDFIALRGFFERNHLGVDDVRDG